MTAPLYTVDILRLATSLAAWPRLTHADATVEKRSAICGSRVTVDIAVDGQGRVAAFGQDVRACALGQASAALLAAHVTGRDGRELEAARQALTDYLSGTADDIGDWPGIEILRPARDYPARHPSIRLPFEAAAEALASAQAKAAAA